MQHTFLGLALTGLMSTVCVASSASRLTGDDATTLANALVSAGVPNSAMAPARFQVNADSLSCEISGATAGNLRCEASAGGQTYVLDLNAATDAFRLLSDLGGTKGGAHSGKVSASAQSLHCEHDVDRPSTDVCALTLD